MTTDRDRDIRVLIADDEALVRAGFTLLVGSAPGLRVVGEASDGVQAVRQARALQPDVVLMDIRMPVMDGLEATRVLLDGGQGPLPRILIVTTFDEDEHVFAALRGGASGFVLKDTPPAARQAGLPRPRAARRGRVRDRRGRPGEVKQRSFRIKIL